MQSDYFAYLASRGRLLKLLRRLMLRPLLRHLSGRILDIGCGIGEVLRMCPDSVGIDSDIGCISYCRADGLLCVQATAAALPFAAGSFDGVLLNNVLEHLEHPEEAFNEIRKVLKRGGVLVIELPGKKGYRHDPTHIRYWDCESITDFLAARDFIDIRAWFYPVPFAFAGDFLTHNKLRVVAIHAK